MTPISLSNMDLMLASSPDCPPVEWLERNTGDGRWLVQEKVDGLRVLAAAGRLITRNGLDITDRFPEVDVPHDWWLDAEIAVLDADGRADFEATNRRAKGGQGGDATLHVFDALAFGDKDLRGDDFYLRWMALSFLGDHEQVTVLGLANNPIQAWEKITARGGEGLVAKMQTGRYIAGRQRSVVKLKHRDTTEVVVVGRTPGEGSRASSFGSLKVALVDFQADSGVQPVGEVGSGFSGADIVDVMELLAAGAPFVIEVSHMGWTSGGKLRHPVFERIRHDVDVLSCTVGAT